jgi:thioredoxin reductase
MLASDVENFPGFDGSIKGPVLMERIRRQAE